MNKSKTNPVSALFLVLAAVIWGSAFVAQSVGMDYIGPFTFNAVRSLIGALVLLPLVCARRSRASAKPSGAEKRRLWSTGILCGLILTVASNLQQIGLLYTTVGKSGFITALYIILVPVLGIFLGKRTSLNTWISVALAVIGLYLLCMNEKLVLGRGDLLTVLCAVVFSFHILTVDTRAYDLDGVAVSCIQFLTCSVLSGIAMFITEHTSLQALWAARIPILYAGVMSCGVAYTLQIVGQQGVEPTLASLLMSLESVVAVLAGWILLGQVLTLREAIGCVVMFIAIVLAQLPGKSKGRSNGQTSGSIA